MTDIAIKLAREQQIAALVKRDGTKCQYPGCDRELDFSAPEDDPRLVTIDHWIPQKYGKDNDWTYEQVNDLNNLKLMCKKCNAKKGDRLPNDDGTIPEKAVRKFRYRRDKRANRPELCVDCDNGHNLMVGEICASCGCDAQRFPRWAKVKTQDCDHEIMWCIWCSIGVIERESSVGIAMRQADSDELGEYFDPEE